MVPAGHGRLRPARAARSGRVNDLPGGTATGPGAVAGIGIGPGPIAAAGTPNDTRTGPLTARPDSIGTGIGIEIGPITAAGTSNDTRPGPPTA